ncbi:MAG TPA: SDR family oxidoreductase, partial [Candidatus Acidoferrum sp.]|nr:SDR family oxidoreductase [Candidatus Acidoferrum sp.]
MSDDNKLNRRQMLGGVSALGAATLLAAAGTQSAQAQSQAPLEPAVPYPDYGPSQAPTITDVKGKVAFITGGSSGIGLGIAKVFFEAGMKVVIGYYSDKHIGDALKQFPANDPRLHSVRLDVLERDSWPKVADEIEKKFGPLNILVNNAGVGLNAPASTGTFKDWDWGLGVNLMGPVCGIHTFVPRMLASKQGCHI